MAAILYLFFFTIIFDDASLPKKQFGFFHLSLEVSINKKLKICLKNTFNNNYGVTKK